MPSELSRSSLSQSISTTLLLTIGIEQKRILDNVLSSIPIFSAASALVLYFLSTAGRIKSAIVDGLFFLGGSCHNK